MKTFEPSRGEQDCLETNPENFPANPFYCPTVLELLENTYIPMTPFISCMVPRHSGYPDFVRKTNAVNESSFNINKNVWHLQRPMHNGDFVREHFDLVNGKIKHVLSHVYQSRKKLNIL